MAKMLFDNGRMGQHNSARSKRLLVEQIIDTYENVNAEYDKEGKIITEGENWLTGIEDFHQKVNIALLYENQANHFLNEATDTDSSGSFQTIAFPMIRRIYSKLLANEIVSVQAMSHPSGSLFFFYPNISERVAVTESSVDYLAHTSPHARNLATCVGANCPDTTYNTCKSLYDRFYDDGLFDLSRGRYTIITATGTPVKIGTDGCYAAFDSFKIAADGTIRSAIFGVSGFDGSNPGTSVGHQARLRGGMGLEIDTQAFMTSFTVVNTGSDLADPEGNVIYRTGDVVQTRFVAQKYGESIVEYTNLCDANGTLVVELDLTAPVAPTSSLATYDGYIGVNSGSTLTGTRFAFAWRRYDDLEYETEMGEVTFELKKVDVSVTSRKLRARWSPELAQDVNSYHSIDADVELTAMLSEQIAMEIDREILIDLKKGAAWKRRWNYLGWRNANVGSQKYTQKEWNQTLVTVVNQISAQIHKSTLRGGASFIVISTEASAILDDLEMFMVSSSDLESDKYNLGMRKVGTLSGRYTVYVDPYAKANDILIGHKGSSILDTGYVYAPYVAAQLTTTLTDPNNFTSVKGIMTRYAKHLVNNRYYGKIFIDHIPTFDSSELR